MVMVFLVVNVGRKEMTKEEEFAKKVKEATAWMDGSGYLHAKPKDKHEGKSI